MIYRQCTSFGADALPGQQVLAFVPDPTACSRAKRERRFNHEKTRDQQAQPGCSVGAGITQRQATASWLGLIYNRINERRVERLIDALRLSRASGVAIENLAGDDIEKLAAPVQTPRPKRRGRKASSDSPGSSLRD